MTLEQVLEAQGWDEQRLRSDAREHAIRAITGDLILEAVARTEDLEVSAEELGAEISMLAAQVGQEPKQVAQTLERSGQIVSLASDIIRSKALDTLVDKANVNDGDAAADTSPDSDADQPTEHEAEAQP